MLQCVAVCSSVQQCVAVYCSVLQCVAVCCCSALRCVAVCGSVLQSVFGEDLIKMDSSIGGAHADTRHNTATPNCCDHPRSHKIQF